MPSLLPSYRRLYVCVVIAFTVGTGFALANSIQWLLILVAIVALLAVAQRAQPNLTEIRLTKFQLLVLIATPLIAFGYTKWRSALTPANPLLRYAGRTAIFRGQLLEKLPCERSDCERYTLSVERVLFPERRPLKTKTQLSVYQSTKDPLATTQSTILALKKPLLLRVKIKAGDNDHMPYQGTQPGKNPPDNSPSERFLVSCTTSDITACDTTFSEEGTRSLQDSIQSEIESVLEEARRIIVTAHIKALTEEQGSLLASMVLGDKAIKLTDNVVNDFRTIGLSHIVAASGFNLTLVISMSYFLAMNLLQREKHRALLVFILLTFFVLLAGFSASIVRAAIMCSVLIASRLFKRKSDIAATIATAALLTLLIEPRALLDLGLQLSYAATLGITCGAQSLTDFLQVSPSKFGRAIADVTGTCLIAQLSVLPLQVFSFWNANLLFLVANVLVLPLVGPITVVGFASSIIALASILMPGLALLSQFGCDKIDSVISLPLTYVLMLTHHLSAQTWAQLHLGKPTLLQVIGYYCCFIVFIVALRKQWHRTIVFTAPIIALFILLIRPPTSAMALGILQTGTVIASNQGDAAVFPFPKTVERDKAIEQFLNFVAAKNITRVLPKPRVTQTSGSCEITSIENACSIWTDTSIRRSVIYLNSPYRLKPTLEVAGECLGLLKNTAHRILILRMDSEPGYLLKHPPVRVFDDVAQVMAACGVKKATIVFSSKQYLLFSPLFQNLHRDDSPPDDLPTRLIVAKQLQAVTLSKDQITPRNHESIE